MSVERLKMLIKKLNFGVGHDGIHSVFFIYLFIYLLQYGSVEFLSNSKIDQLLLTCYSHGYIPVEMLNGNVTLIIKM